jgi:hypothetical protein
MAKYDIEQITYTKDDGSASNREIIVMSKPQANIMAIEVSELSQEQRDTIQTTLRRHAEELKALNVAWKQFKPVNIS